MGCFPQTPFPSLPLGPPCCYSLVPTRVLVLLFQKSSCLPLRAEPGLAWLPVFRSLPCSPFWESLSRKEACENQPPFLALGHSVHPAGRRMGLELYLDLLSQPCRAVYIFAKKNHIPFELRNMELFKGEESAWGGGTFLSWGGWRWSLLQGDPNSWVGLALFDGFHGAHQKQEGTLPHGYRRAA